MSDDNLIAYPIQNFEILYSVKYEIGSSFMIGFEYFRNRNVLCGQKYADIDQALLHFYQMTLCLFICSLVYCITLLP